MIYIGEKRKRGGDSFWSSRHWRKIGRGKEQRKRKEQLQPRLSRYAPRCFWNSDLYLIFFPREYLMVLLILCGRKGPQFVLLRLVACLFTLFWFWMSLMSSEAYNSMPECDHILFFIYIIFCICPSVFSPWINI